MKTYKKNVFEILKESQHIEIPFYQREYTWESKDVMKLIKDVENNRSQYDYYLGTIIQKIDHHKRIIIDGQQRITTILLIFKALSLQKEQLNLENQVELKEYIKIEFNSKNLKNSNFLQIILKDQEDQFSDSKFQGSNYWINFKIIKEHFIQSIRNNQLNNFYNKFKKVMFCLVLVQEEIDDFTLFEQINSTGKKLSGYDLVKNYLFSKLFQEHNKDAEIDIKVDCWLKKISFVFDDLKNDSEKTGLIRHYIASLTYILVKKDDAIIYEGFQKIQNDKNKFQTTIKLFESLCCYGQIYKFLIKREWESNLYSSFHDSLNVIMNSFNTYASILVDIFMNNSQIEQGQIKILPFQIEEIKNSLLIIETYLVRRFFNSDPEKTITRYIPRIAQQINSIESDLKYHEKLLYILQYKKNNDKKHSYEMPVKSIFMKTFPTFQIYEKSKFCKIILERILRWNNKNKIDTSKAQIEHVLPKSSDAWLKDYDEEKKDKINYLKNTIGNLTLTVINAEMSNKEFLEKKALLLKNDSISLNKYFYNLDKWEIEEIETRAQVLLQIMNNILDVDQFKKNLFNVDGTLKTIFEKDKEINDLEVSKIDYESNHGKTMQNNISYFKKIEKISFKNIEEVIYNFLVEGLSYQKCEIKIFDYDASGWITKSIVDFLKINKDDKGQLNKSEFDNKLITLTPTINHLVEVIKREINE